MRRFFLIELLAYAQGWWSRPVRKPQERSGAIGRFIRLATLEEAALAVVALWIMGGFRNLGG
jgi:hypothetical protein